MTSTGRVSGPVEVSPESCHTEFSMPLFLMETTNRSFPQTLLFDAGWSQDVCKECCSSACCPPPSTAPCGLAGLVLLSNPCWHLRSFARRFLNHTCNRKRNTWRGIRLTDMRKKKSGIALFEYKKNPYLAYDHRCFHPLRFWLSIFGSDLYLASGITGVCGTQCERLVCHPYGAPPSMWWVEQCPGQW